jgi:uncharacterized protein DUF87
MVIKNSDYKVRVFSFLLATVILCLGFKYFLKYPILEKALFSHLFLFVVFVLFIISVYLIEPFFTKPKDSISSSLNILILLIPVIYDKEIFPAHLKIILISYCTIVLILSSVSCFLFDKDSALTPKDKISSFLKNIAVKMGAANIIFPIIVVSVLSSSFYYDPKVWYFTCFFIFLILFDVVGKFTVFICLKKKGDENLEAKKIGVLEAVQSNITFIFKTFDYSKRKKISMFDFVEFKYSSDGQIYRGIVIARYFLDDGEKIKVLRLNSKKSTFTHKLENNFLYSVSQNDMSSKDRLKLENFVGIIIEKTDITEIKFEYSSKKLLSDGDLLQVAAKNKEGSKVEIIYQVTNAVIDTKNIEEKNEIGLIIGTAVQLGVWQIKDRNFENYGWVPQINSPVYFAKDIKGPEVEETEIKLGTIEDTGFNVLANVEELVTHHTAILGTTGTGKSVFARSIIKKIAEKGVKIFCVDLTGEVKKFVDSCILVDSDASFIAGGAILDDRGGILRDKSKAGNIISAHIESIVNFKGCCYGRDPRGYGDLVRDVSLHMKTELKKFIDGENAIGILELPELSNTEETLEYTKIFFKVLFDLAKEEEFKKNKACIVLEEAHTLIPEWNSVAGTDDKTARRVTNTIAQIALQGRKYDVGLLVIAQRTANVSKTILTQCNTIISFKQFDNTSKEFLANHFGSAFTSMLGILKKRRAIAVGKAIVSDVPIVFKVPEIEEELIVPNVEKGVEKTKNIELGNSL